MYVQVITYSLEGIDEEDYLDVANELAARTAGLPGLLAKIWLENEGGNRYGGVYFWEDLESMQRFGQSDLFEGRVPEFADSVVEEFAVLENLTALTQPVLEILEPRQSRGSVAAPAAPATGAVTAGQPSTRKRTPPARKASVTAGGTTAKRAASATGARATAKKGTAGGAARS